MRRAAIVTTAVGLSLTAWAGFPGPAEAWPLPPSLVAPVPPVPVSESTPPAGGAAAGSRLTPLPPPGPTRILRLADVKPGMVGEALTVFQGTKPERFKVRVVSVMRQFLPKQDVILIRAEDPRVEFSGIVAGMSGSPVYVDGRLMGAIAYGWSFSKVPLGGVTPIETMLAERARPRRTRSELSIEVDGDGNRNLTLAEGGPGSETTPAVGSPRTAFAAGAAEAAGGVTPAAPRIQAQAQAQPHLVRVAVPLSVSGFDPRVLGALTEELATFGFPGLLAVQGAGGGPARVHTVARAPVAGSRPPARASVAANIQPGSAIGIELVRGDMSMVGTGTVTYVDQQGVLAFGHPMFGAGEIYLPLVEAQIHAILPSVSQSMKLSSPLREVGALVQDRQSCVVGDLGARATMVPVTVRVRAPGAETRVFRAEVARNRRLTPTLASLVISNALVDSEPDAAEMVVKVASTITLKGRPAIQLRDEIFAPEGVSRQSLATTRGLRAVSELLSNPFEPVVLDRLDIELQIEYGRDVAEIVALSAPGQQVRPGQTIQLRATLRPYHGREYTQLLPVSIPATFSGDTVRIEVASGSVAKPDTPTAESLSIYLDNLRRYFAPSALVVGVQTADDGAALHGRLLPDLPASAADTLRSGNQTRRAEAFRVVERTVFPTSHLIFGRQEITVSVAPAPVVGADRP